VQQCRILVGAAWGSDNHAARSAASGAELERWFGKRDADVVLVRPDRNVLGTGTDLDVITAHVGECLASDRERRSGAGGSSRPAG
jgi:hypothetical protein